MALGKEQLWTMSQLEEALLSAAERLPPDQACKCHSHLYKLSSVIHTPESALVVKWNDVSVVAGCYLTVKLLVG